MRLHTRVYGHCKRVCTESWLWDKNPLPHRGIQPASSACRTDALTNWATSPPREQQPKRRIRGVAETRLCHSTLPVGPIALLVLGIRPRTGELRTQKLKSHLPRIQSLKVLPLKTGKDQYLAIHATLIARDFFVADFYPSGPFTCIFLKTSPEFFPG